MSNLPASNQFGKTEVPSLSSSENTASYTVSAEMSSALHEGIVAYYTFPGLDDYLNTSSASRDIKEDSFLPKDIKLAE